MRICLSITGIATVIIGLHLFSPKLSDAKAEFGIPYNNLSHQSWITSRNNTSKGLELIDGSSQEFEPRDNGGPAITRGSGTR